MRFVLVLDATPAHARQLIDALERGGHATRVLAKPAEAEQILATGACDGLIVDTWITGIEFVKRVRRRWPHRTLMTWTATSSSAEAADALEAGATEALDGAMSARELLVRAERAARLEVAAPGARVTIGGLSIDAAHAEVAWNGVPLPLTPREREVLHVLAEAGGRPVPRETLYRHVWGYTMARGDRSVDVNVKRLRAKLASLGHDAVRIVTQPGVGYRLEIGAAAGDARAPAVTRL